MTDLAPAVCSSCGAASTGTRFCESCGARMDAGAASSAPAQPTAAAASAVPPVAPSSGWQEPTRSAVLTWGDYETRIRLSYGLITGLFVLMLIDAVVSRSSFTYGISSVYVTLTIFEALLGIAAVLALPGALPRRAAAAALVAVSLLFVFLPQGSYIFSYASFLTNVLCVLAWLIARERPGITYLLLIAIPVLGIVLVYAAYPFEFSGGATSAVIVSMLNPLVLTLGVAWLARAFAPAAERARARNASRIAAPYGYQPLAAAPGMQPGAVAPGYAPAMYQPVRTNSFAIVALVFGIIGGTLLPVIFGHIALSQIRRTGEGGRGMALAGTVLGYIWTAALVIYLIVLFSIIAHAASTPYYGY